MKKTMYFKSEQEMNKYFANGVPSNVLAIVQPNAESGAVLFTSSNNGPMKGITAPQGGYNTDPADEARITYIESYYATQEYVDDAIAEASMGADIDLSDYALKSELPSLDGYATQTWVENQDYLTQHQDISEKADKSELASYVSKNELSSCGYLTTHQDLSNYALKSELPTVPSLEGYATESYVISKIEDVVGAAPAALDTLKEIGDSLNNDSDFAGTMTTALASKANASDVYTKTEIDNAGYLTSHQSLADYATKAEISAAGYLTSHQSLAGYATEQYVDDAVANVSPSIDLSSYVTKSELSAQSYATTNISGKYWLGLSNESRYSYFDMGQLSGGNSYIMLKTRKVGGTMTDYDYAFAWDRSGNAIFSSHGTSLGTSISRWQASYFKNTYTTNLFLGSNNTNITTMFPSYSYVDNKIGSIETALDSILGNS